MLHLLIIRQYDVLIFADSCTIKTCANGGTCVLDDDYTASCICKGEWNGTNCESKINIKLFTDFN